MGDAFAGRVVQSSEETLREGDTLARLGGDEFVVVLMDLTEVAECERVLARMLAAAALPVSIKDLVLTVSASMGSPCFRWTTAMPTPCCAMRTRPCISPSNRGATATIFFDVDQDVAIKMRHESLEHIGRALDQNEFVLYYQPKVNMRTGTVIGAEALIRWQHPQRGLLLPGVFLPVIGDHAISVAVGEWVIATALAQMREWNAAGLNITVSVNVGARQFLQPILCNACQPCWQSARKCSRSNWSWKSWKPARWRIWRKCPNSCMRVARLVWGLLWTILALAIPR